MFNPKKCTFPWTDLQINYDGTYGVCCFHAPFKRPTDNLLELWNSSQVLQMRMYIEKYDAVESICHHCAMHYKDSEQNTYDTHTRELLPYHLYINFGLQCNLSCIMCSQKGIKKEYREILDPHILYNQIESLEKLKQITIIGGEPFAINEVINFLKFLSEYNLRKKVRVKCITNGTLIHNYIDILSKFEKFSLSFSVDSYGEYYERIRLGARWNRVKENIEMFNQLINKKAQWDCQVSCLLMKSGLPGLYELTKWCIKNKLPLNYDRVFEMDNTDINKENIFEHKGLLDDYPEYLDIFLKCISLLKNNNYNKQATQLLTYLSLIECSPIIQKLNKEIATAQESLKDLKILKIQRDALLASRWRKLGRKLGVVKTLPFEELNNQHFLRK
jgi:MoaA/NifB/PqqE/SkfB family radical SAM enzyme